MIPSLLILGATVRGAQVKRVVRPHVLLQPEGDADEAARALTSSGRGSAGNLRLDHAVRELELLDRCERVEPELLAFFGRHALQLAQGLFGDRDPQTLLALKRGWFRRQIVQPETAYGLERIVLDLGRRGAGQQECRRGGDSKDCGSSHACR